MKKDDKMPKFKIQIAPQDLFAAGFIKYIFAFGMLPVSAIFTA